MKDSSDATVGERLVERISLTHALLDDNERLRAEIARLRLTDAEREAVQWAAIRSADDAQMIGGDFYLACHRMRARSATLRTLLERLT